MSSNYSPSKRQRETDQARKRQEEEQTRMAKRGRAPGRTEIVSASEMNRNLPSIEAAMRNLEGGRSAARSADAIPARLFVGGISDEASEAELRAAFAEFGAVAEAVIIRNRDTRESRGFGFVTTANRRAAPRTIEVLDRMELKGKNLVVHVATDRAR